MLMKVNKEIDLDWIEIRDMCEMDCSVDQLRKMAQGVRPGLFLDTLSFLSTHSGPADSSDRLDTVSPLHSNLQVANFQVCEHAFPLPAV